MKKMIIVFFIIIFSFSCIYMQNHWLEVSNYELNFPNLPESFNEYKIVHLSDLHDQSFGKNQSQLVEKINAINPDIIFFTGDLIDRKRYNLDRSMDLIYGLIEKYKIYYVTGNHEEWSGKINEIESALLKAGVVVLRNKIITIEIDGDKIDIIGVDDPEFDSELPLFGIDKFSIMLSHRSELIEYYKKSKVDVVFAGHAHGGQIRLFGRGLIAPNQGLFLKYTEGIHELGKTNLVISRGLGNSIFPIRVFNRPEIVVVKLIKEN